MINGYFEHPAGRTVWAARRTPANAKVLAPVVGLALTLAQTTTGLACPSYLEGRVLGALAPAARSEVRLFKIDGDDQAGRRWVSLPVQIDPLDAAGVLRGDPEGGQPLMTLAPESGDRVTLRRDGFGARAQAGDPAPCPGATKAVEISDPDAPSAYAYLTFCPGDLGRTLPPGPLPVAHDPLTQRIHGPRFDYVYQPNNQLMYKTMIARHSSWPAPVDAAADADLTLHLDIRKFFTMDFSNKDVESYVSQTRTGPLGMVGSIEFYLRILFLKINLKMATTVGFYGDAAHIPTIIDVPRDATKTLNQGSGILYTWTPKGAVIDQSAPASTLPNADPELIRAGTAAVAERGHGYCLGAGCTYRLRGTVGPEAFGIDIMIPRNMVDMGFYPAWVPDVAGFKQAMGWDVDHETEKGRIGIYFMNSGLRQGRYSFDQWIRIGENGRIAASCPRPVTTHGTVELTGKVPGIAH